jgi:2-polyprenyl-3-methyl-5-hydroxy-6-metoxy-1,4-benzoquinol methylase
LSSLGVESYIKQRSSELSGSALEKIKKALPDNKIYQYLWHKSQILQDSITPESEQKFVTAYKNVAESHWPAIKSIDDFWNLPIYIQEECIKTHKYSPKIWFDLNCDYNTWSSSADDWVLDPDALMKYQNIVLDNSPYIKGKKVLDLACGNGHISLAIACCDPETLTLTDIRPKSLSMAKEVLDMVFQNKLHVLCADLHDYDLNTKLCQEHDTVFLCGSMYHVNDHFAILESIAKGQPKNIIIEGRQQLSIAESLDPLIFFISESTALPYNGWQNHKSKIVVGFPNPAWFDLAMKDLGYRRVKPTRLDIRKAHIIQKHATFSEQYKSDENIWAIQVYELT